MKAARRATPRGREECFRKKLDWIGEQFGIQKQSDWYSVSHKQVKKLKGTTQLLTYYDYSLSNALKANYPEFHWNPLEFQRVPRNHWTQKSNQRMLFDSIAEQLGIQTQSDWYAIVAEDISNHGGDSLMCHVYNRSLHQALQSIYPEFTWDLHLFRSVPQKHWKEATNHVLMMDRLAEQLGITYQEDWYRVQLEDIESVAGSSFIASYYSGSLISALESVYPQYQWHPHLFSRVPMRYWSEVKNKRKAMDWVSEQLGIEVQEDWYNVSAEEVKSLIGEQLIGGSLYHFLSEVYPEFEWNAMKLHFVPQDRRNQRILLDWIGEQFGIEKQQDWFSITEKKLKEVLGSDSKLSLLSSLQTVYPEFDWDQSMWDSIEDVNLIVDKIQPLKNHPQNQSKMLDWIAEKLGIESQEDWYSVTVAQATEAGAGSLIRSHRGSLFATLEHVYPQYEWNPLRFKRLPSAFSERVPYNHWKLKENQRQNMDKIAHQLGVETQSDWYNVTNNLVVNAGGASVLRNYYNNSLFAALKSIYPEYDWDPLLSQNLPRMLLNCVPHSHWKNVKNQRVLMDQIAEHFGIEKQQDWYHLTSKQFRSRGGDSIIKHYYKGSWFAALQNIYPEFIWNPLLHRKNRWKKLHKLRNCRKVLDRIAEQCGIKRQDEWYEMIENKMETVGGSPKWIILSLKKAYPEFSWKSMKSLDAPQLLLAQVWTHDIDPTGYWMSEKFDGSRAIWDGRKFISRLGEIWNAPDWFTADLPKDVCLDGEMWAGRGAYEFVTSLVRRKDADQEWKQAVFKVFDVPSLKNKVFEERMEWIQEYINTHKPQYMQLVHQEKCKGVDELKKRLQEIEDGGGEGIMLREPNSLYVPKRSSTLLKVKSFLDTEARVIAYQPHQGKVHVGQKPKMGALICELADGRTFILGRGFSDEVRANPPAIGSVVTFSYIPSNSGMPKFSSYIRTRHDIEWKYSETCSVSQ